MVFAQGFIADPKKTGAGETRGTNNTILGKEKFEDGLKIGLFAKIDTAILSNVDASAAPVIAGVVLRSVDKSISDADTIDANYYGSVSYIRSGLVAVHAVPGQVPTEFQKVYAHNTADANVGKASIVVGANGVVNCEYIEAVDTDIWLVRLY